MAWYAVYTAGGKEPLANLWLRRRGFETYFPHEKIDPRWEPKDDVRAELSTVRALLPRYLFVNTGFEHLYEINQMTGFGVNEVVCAAGDEPFPIPDSVIDALRSHLTELGRPYPHKPKNSLKVGQMVRGLEGWHHWGLVGHVAAICGENVAVELVHYNDRRITAPSDSFERMSAVA